MKKESSSFEIHVHGQVALLAQATKKQVIEALEPLWTYRGEKTFDKGATSFFTSEKGFVIDVKNHVLNMCWTVEGEANFKESIADACANLNELSACGSAIEVNFFDLDIYNVDFDDHTNNDDDGDGDDDGDDDGPQDDDIDEMFMTKDEFIIMYVGPNPEEIMKARRNVVVTDITETLSEHFETDEIDEVIKTIDKLYEERLNSLNSMINLSSILNFSKKPNNGQGDRDQRPRTPHTGN